MSWSIKLHLGSLGSGDCLIVTFPDYCVTQPFNERTTRGPRLPPCVLRRNGDAEASGILKFFLCGKLMIWDFHIWFWYCHCILATVNTIWCCNCGVLVGYCLGLSVWVGMVEGLFSLLHFSVCCVLHFQYSRPTGPPPNSLYVNVFNRFKMPRKVSSKVTYKCVHFPF